MYSLTQSRRVRCLLLGLSVLGALCAVQQPFREYPGFEYEQFPLPPDYRQPSEWVFARLMYPSVRISDHGPANPDWAHGRASWTMDYPRSDRHLSQAVRRLTRIDARSVEQPVNLDDGDDVFHWPWLYGVEVGHWDLTDSQAKKLREYLLRGGFFMCDDFHGDQEWEVFTASMKRVFPDRPIVEIPNEDQIFHTVFDVNERYQVPGWVNYPFHKTYEHGGTVPHWRGIYDDKGRIMAAMCFDMDLGDSWEHADNPKYPEKFSSLGIRLGVNYIVYAMSH
jgi:hypothetical protein